MASVEPANDLRSWLEDGYPRSVRTAYLILGNRPDAEDAVQEAFLRAWRFRESLSKEASIRPWLYRIVVNTCNSKLRKEIPLRGRTSNDEDLTNVVVNDDVPSRIALSNDVLSALEDLPAHLRVVIVLRYYAELSEREIGIAIGRPHGTVKSRLHEARRRLGDHPALRRESSTGFTNSEEATS